MTNGRLTQLCSNSSMKPHRRVATHAQAGNQIVAEPSADGSSAPHGSLSRQRPKRGASASTPPVQLVPTNMPYWGFDHEIDIRAEGLWWLAVTLTDAMSLAESLSEAVEVVPPQIRLGLHSSDVVTEIKEDPEVLPYVIDAMIDAEYEQPTDDGLGVLIFDSVLSDAGHAIPVQLVVHELAHHVEFLQHGGLGSHEDEFDEALIELIGRSWSILGLDSWSQTAWERLRPAEPAGPSRSDIDAARIRVMRTKWQRLLLDDD